MTILDKPPGEGRAETGARACDKNCFHKPLFVKIGAGPQGSSDAAGL